VDLREAANIGHSTRRIESLIEMRTTFHVLAMYTQLLEPNVLSTEVMSEPLKMGDKQAWPTTHAGSRTG
jgi:hypothetical protein